MVIFNNTKNIVLVEDYVFCSSLFSKARGLMFSGKKNLVMDFSREKLISVHNMFVFFPIDLIFLSNEKIVFEINRNFRPFRLYYPRKKARYLLELCSPRLKEGRADINDKIEF